LIRNFVTLSLVLGLSSCSQESTNDELSRAAADYVFTNGIVYTMNEAQPEAEAIAVSGNRIAFVGSAADAESWIGDDTAVLDLAGKMMLPGFVSTHDHIIAAAWLGSGLNLYKAKNKDDILEIVKADAEANPDKKMIFGMGWSKEMLGGWPTAADLDRVVTDRPVFLVDFTGHEGWLNSKALEDGNITKDTPDSNPGTIYWMRDDGGNPTGVGIEFQWTATFIAQGGWQPDTMIPNSVAQLHATAIKGGMTTFTTPGPGTPTISDDAASLVDYQKILEILTALDAEGELGMRAFVLPWFKVPAADPVNTVAITARLARKYNGDKVRAAGVKVHPESGWLGQGAPMLEPYKGSDKQGGFGVSPERTKALVLEANKHGLDVIIHVEGDASTRAAIDAFEASIQAGNTDARNSLHHMIWGHPDDYKRILELGIAVNATPQFTTTWSGQEPTTYRLMGKERTMTRFGLYSDLPHDGGRLALSADYPSTPEHMIAPLYVMQTAMTLMDPDDPDSKHFPPTRKQLTLEQGLRAITIDAAWILRMEDKIGSLEVGKYADIVILEEDLREVDAKRIKDVKVLATIMDGRFTHRDGI